MENVTVFAPLGFWLFLACLVVACFWSGARKRETQQETLRRIVESGQELDPAMIDKLLSTDKDSKGYEGLKVSGVITMSAAPGLAIFGYFLGVFDKMIGIALLVGVVGAGIYLSGKMSERWYNESKG
jgi:hypothetical protein